MDPHQISELWSDIIRNGRPERPTEAVLFELAEYADLEIENVRDIISNTNNISLVKWQESDRSTPEGLISFYNSVSNWVFGTSHFHARQAEGVSQPSPAFPVQVASAIDHVPHGRHLDFGAGVGTASLLFARLGWQVALADVSDPLLDFARWRFAHRNVKADILDLKTERLGVGEYDLITAFNTMAHVPAPEDTFRDLRNALKPGGLLIFDVDAREKAAENQWFLYRSHDQLIRSLRRIGFARRDRIGPMFVYQRVETTDTQRLMAGLYDQLRYSALASNVLALSRPVRRRIRRLVSGNGAARKNSSLA